MVKAVIGDETYVEGFIDRILQSGVTLQVGLAVGRLGTGSGRDAVFALIPTPQNEGQDVTFLEGESKVGREADKKKGSKGKSATLSLQIDMVWVAEHARQVSKMLLGGISVVGIYILASESIVKNSTALLWQTLKMVASAADASVNNHTTEDLLLLHFSYSPRRVMCRSCSIGSSFNTNNLRPCEWKLARTLSTVHSISCMYNFESRVPIYANESPEKRLLDTLMFAISSEASRLESSLVLSNGSLVAADDKTLIGEADHEVDFFLPLDPPAEFKNGAVTGLAILKGSVRAQTYGFSRDPLLRAVADLKADIVKSLKSRLEILLDEIDEAPKAAASDMDATKGSLHPLQRRDCAEMFRCTLPRRLLIPWLEGIYLCDYLQDGESFQDVDSRRKELLGVDEPLDPSKVLEHEGEVMSLKERSFWDVSLKSNAPGKTAPDTTQVSKQSMNASNVATATNGSKLFGAAALFVLLVAIIASYVVMTMRFDDA